MRNKLRIFGNVDQYTSVYGYQYKSDDKPYTLHYGTYNGDSTEKQLLVYKKDIR